jgi:uncharacterized protein Yka (UPF0111/DUF47 family)
MEGGVMLRRWFLPASPDVIGLLRRQAAITVEGIDALVAWTGGEDAAADRVRACEHRADDEKRELRRALTAAFVTPLEPEDLFELSRDVDEILNSAKDLVREAEVMGTRPDPAMAEMAGHLGDGVRRLEAAFASLARADRADRSEQATAEADAAVKAQRHLEHAYRRAMSALIDQGDLREVAARRELYRRLARTGDELVRAAERVWYSVLKER